MLGYSRGYRETRCIPVLYRPKVVEVKCSSKLLAARDSPVLHIPHRLIAKHLKAFALAAFAAASASSFACVAFAACATFAVCVTFVMLNLGNLHRVIFRMHSPLIACAAIVACAAHVAKKECHEKDERAHDDVVKPKEGFAIHVRTLLRLKRLLLLKRLGP